MSYFRTCPDCGAHLDSGERCDCRDEKETNNEKFNRILNNCKQPRQVCAALMALHTKGEKNHDQN